MKSLFSKNRNKQKSKNVPPSRSEGRSSRSTRRRHSLYRNEALLEYAGESAHGRVSLASASTRVQDSDERPVVTPSQQSRRKPSQKASASGRFKMAHTERALPIELYEEQLTPHVQSEQPAVEEHAQAEQSEVPAISAKPELARYLSGAHSAQSPEQRVIPSTSASRKPVLQGSSRKQRHQSPKKHDAVGLESEIFGVMLIFVGVLIILALASFAPEQIQVLTQTKTPFALTQSNLANLSQNWVGPLGVMVADGLTQFLGHLAYLIPLCFFYLGALFLGSRLPWPNGMHVGGLILTLWGTSTWLELAFRAPQTEHYAAGGWIGILWYQSLVPLLAEIGTGLFAFVLILSGVLVFFNMSIRSLFGHIKTGLSALVSIPQKGGSKWEDVLSEIGDEDILDSSMGQAASHRASSQSEHRGRSLAPNHFLHDAPEFELEAISVTPTKSRPPYEEFNDTIMDDATKCGTPSSLENQKAIGNIKNEPTSSSLNISVELKSDEDDAITQSARPSGVQKSAKNAKQEASKEQDTEADAPLKIVERADESVEIDDHAIQKDRKYIYPPLKLLDFDAPNRMPIDGQQLQVEADKLVRKFADFGIDGKVNEVRPGPVVTTFEFVPAPGIKLSKIASLSDDIAMAMEAVQVRIVAPIPGKGAVGIEIPNERRETVFLKEIMADKTYQSKVNDKLLMALGKDIEGKPYYANLAEMPHALISGTTGSGKSVSVNGMITSILYRAKPDEVKFMMIDPKMLELSIYEGIPHLLLPPIIDSKKAANALQWAVAEMERRYLAMSEVGVRSLAGFNKVITQIRAGVDPAKRKAPIGADGKPYDKMPYIVIVIDEYADLLSIAGKEVEGYVMRLAQKARAAGIHVMLATQRPSVDVITGVIKANFPVRMGFRLASTHDSKTIINRPGAEKLLGRGDMLIMPAGTSNITRVHGAFISEHEIHRVVEHLKRQGKPEYNMEILNPPVPEASEDGEEDKDEKWGDAIDLIRQHQRCSTSWLQRHLGIGYNRAARLVDSLEAEGIVGPQQNAKGDRDIFVR